MSLVGYIPVSSDGCVPAGTGRLGGGASAACRATGTRGLPVPDREALGHGLTLRWAFPPGARLTAFLALRRCQFG